MAKKKSLFSKLLRGVVKGVMSDSAKVRRNNKRRAKSKRI